MSDIKFKDDIVEEFLVRIETGESITSVCRDPRMPGRTSVYNWSEADTDFGERFRAARARGVHALAEQCLEIADETPRDAIHVADKRVRIDTRLRLAGKWLASEYGDKVDVNYKGEMTHKHDLSSLSADDLDALEALVAKSSDAGGDTLGAGKALPNSVH